MVVWVVLLLLALISFAQAYVTSRPALASRFTVRLIRSSTQLKMSTPDPMDAIRAKMQADPNYDPMKDPEAMRILDSMIPEQLREFGNAIAKLKVALADSITGVESVKDLNKRVAGMEKKGAISSPTSQWFKSGMPKPTVDKAAKQQAKEEIKRQFPQAAL
ncbi:hypothetical protein EON65_03890 [archaeon]|nr:MAG: hypothetical protein EON65_03890 [archaeon]